jgi:hypothetical protein
MLSETKKSSWRFGHFFVSTPSDSDIEFSAEEVGCRKYLFICLNVSTHYLKQPRLDSTPAKENRSSIYQDMTNAES